MKVSRVGLQAVATRYRVHLSDAHTELKGTPKYSIIVFTYFEKALLNMFIIKAQPRKQQQKNGKINI